MAKEYYRGNVQVQLDYNFVWRVTSHYAPAIDQHVTSNKLANVDKQGRKYSDYIYDNFVGITNLAVATKLYIAADDTMDLQNSCRLRIVDHALSCKRFAVRGIFYCSSDDRLQGDLLDSTNYSLADFITRVSEKDWLSGMIDSYSLDCLKAIARRKFEELINRSFEVKIHNSTNKYRIRLPEFDFENVTLDTIKTYLNNPIFENLIDGDLKTVLRIATLLTLQLATIRWIKRGASQSTIKHLYSESIYPEVDDAKLVDIMNEVKIWNINDYYSDKTLNYMIEESAHRWNTGIVRSLSKFLSIADMEYSKFGTKAQLKGHSEAKAALKLSPSDAIIGVAVGFNDSVQATGGFNINYVQNQNRILTEYLIDRIERKVKLITKIIFTKGRNPGNEEIKDRQKSREKKR
ncbi:1850_t:CDS:2 [Dentiscutata erythropus]|uniref:1850_t:CDS:1 n=1 Tax=Dentiscutata erythropus TaxID=1348616 RepID=A0A9N9E4F0_9GLOM|nr:1850_t:CDS:2 [Dentiscutata erythropus]